MLVSLYTSRIVLAALGVEDYGIYNVVGGIVTMLAFLNGTLSTASSRYITVALGLGNLDNMRTVFSSVLLLNVILGVFIVLFSETIGLWLLYNKIVLPEGRLDVAFWVFQISVISIILSLFSVPYNATIIAYERMNVFAYITLFDGFAKLGVAFIITYDLSHDRLITYAFFIFIIHLIDAIIYIYYCIHKFPETKFKMKIDKSLLREIGGFIGWSSYGSLVSVGYTQGLNILLNMFFGTAVNAARAVSVQVQSAVVSFVNNFQVAVNPQITKSFACGEYNDTRSLLTVSSKLSFFLMCILGLPLIANAEYVLKLWLKEVPEHAVNFVQLMIVVGIFQTLANPIRVVNQAEGNIKKFQILECTYLALIVPLSYIGLKFGLGAESVFIVQLIVEISVQFIRVSVVLPKIQMRLYSYFKTIYLRVIVVLFFPLLLSFYIKNIMEFNYLSFVINLVITELLTLLTIFLVGLNESDRLRIFYWIKQYRQKR